MASERKFINENIRRVLLKEYFQRETEMAGFGGIDIQRTPMGTRVTLIVERPGMVIGRKGAKIKDLTRVVSEVYGFDNPQIEVQECRDSAKNPQIMAQKLALALERGWHFRRAGHSTLRRIMDTDAKGCQVKLCGKLTGQRHRTEKFKWGHIKFCGEPAITTMDRGYAIAKKKLGLIGVSVDIMRSDAKLPDEVIIHDIPELRDVAVIKEEPSPDAVEEGAAGTEEVKVEEEKEEKTEAPIETETPGKKKATSKRKSKRVSRRKESEASAETPSEQEKTSPADQEAAVDEQAPAKKEESAPESPEPDGNSPSGKKEETREEKGEEKSAEEASVEKKADIQENEAPEGGDQ
ncbi:MAG TPA: 30S ribosomal protein S3 [Euryarchaeota archaeon]|nr:30S ribosomal protein S3 [Euryarchaeota archaeon]